MLQSAGAAYQPSIDTRCRRPRKPAARRSCLRDQRDRGTDGRTDGHPTVAETLICGVSNAGGEIDRTTYVKSVKSESVDMERSSDGVDAIGDL